MIKPLVIHGIGQTSEVLSALINRQDKIKIVGYTDLSVVTNQKFLGKPVIPLDKASELYNPSEYLFFVAIGYRDGNKLREQYINKIKELGYTLYSYIDAQYDKTCYVGENVVVAATNFIQPMSAIEDGVFIWGNCVIGHHSKLEKCSWISPGVQIGGNSIVGTRCFVGMGAVINQFVSIGKDSVLGTNAFLNKDLANGSVVVEEASSTLDITANKFWRIGGVR